MDILRLTEYHVKSSNIIVDMKNRQNESFQTLGTVRCNFSYPPSKHRPTLIDFETFSTLLKLKNKDIIIRLSSNKLLYFILSLFSKLFQPCLGKGRMFTSKDTVMEFPSGAGEIQ